MRAQPEQTLEFAEEPSLADWLRLLCVLPSIPLGGMERAAIRVVQQMQRSGATVHFLAERHWGTKVQREIEATGAGWTGVRLPAWFGRPRTLSEARTMAVSLAVTGREFARGHRGFGANALLATNLNVAFFARRLAKRDDTASVFRIPNPPVLAEGATPVGLRRMIWRAVYDSFDHLVCNSTYTAKHVAEVVGHERKIRVIRNFPPALDRRTATPAPYLSGDRRSVIFLGQISEAKGVALLLEAAKTVVAQCSDVDFVLAGPGAWRDTFPERLRRTVAENGLGRRFRLIGPVDDVNGLLRQGYLHVCPSLSRGDSFPNVILDAKQAGLPSIVFPTAGLPEAVEHGTDGLVTEEPTAASLAAAILDLLHDVSLRDRMATAAIASLSRFDPNELTERWLDLFRTKP